MKQIVRRLYVEKKREFSVEAEHLIKDLKENLNIKNIKSLQIIQCYDVQGLDEEFFNVAKNNVFSEPNVDNVYEQQPDFTKFDFVFGMSYLPGQFDQRADSAAQCIELLTERERPLIYCSKIIAVNGILSSDEKTKIKKYLINPVDSHEVSLEKPNSLKINIEKPEAVGIIHGFISWSKEELCDFWNEFGFAMTIDDLEFCQSYFRDEEFREPTVTEIKVIDTYWSDHCRHTTFLTEIESVDIEKGLFNEPVEVAYLGYLKDREFVYDKKSKKITLMDIATIAMKKLKMLGKLDNLDQSDEINACSIEVKVDVDGEEQDYLIMFKNETHNHPTEIEPFGGAATCLGGAIRDPLSGRAYVYQAMRITGAADPRTRIEDTLSGKLPQRIITLGAANGYSSYGNQIGLATGYVRECYDENFVAKRMEIGAVIAATPKDKVIREKPLPGDLIILVGGRTGRDGCSGAVGSSKEHTEDSINTCGAEVQKGNAPMERKLQRLFRIPEFSRMIKKCNDFGAGGVCVAIGELADSLSVDLDVVPKKYDGLDGTELAISESQERMAVLIDPADLDTLLGYCYKENLEGTCVAKVTDDGRLKMKWRGDVILDISREFLNTNGVSTKTEVKVNSPDESKNYFKINSGVTDENFENVLMSKLSDLNICSQKGLIERFDSTIGAGTVLMPFGGVNYSTPSEGMVAKVPVLGGETNTGTIMTYGYDSKLSTWSPFHGALYAVIHSIAKVVAMGGDYKDVRMTFQEYFEKLSNDKSRWGKPFSALIGANYAQNKLEVAAIGGKDSMSGSFKDLNVPPTLVSFAVSPVDVRHVVSPEFKKADSELVLVKVRRDESEMPDFDQIKNNFELIKNLIKDEKVLSAYTVGKGGVLASLCMMSFGNKIGFDISKNIAPYELFEEEYGSIVLEVAKGTYEACMNNRACILIGNTIKTEALRYGDTVIDLNILIDVWEKPLNGVFAIKEDVKGKPQIISYIGGTVKSSKVKIAKPRVFIPVFPGTNCEYDTSRAFEKAGATVENYVFKNLNTGAISESIKNFVDIINKSQIIALPGGFSAGDEPDGSGKFIASVFRNPYIKEAVHELLYKRDGLMIGICNGFQALIKLGLLPFGEIKSLDENDATLTHNKIGRHISQIARTKVVSNLSPWFGNVNVGDVFEVAVSHGEGRLYAKDHVINKLISQGQIATQYVDIDGVPSYDGLYNPNGSLCATEGITSPDGRILGKMGHSERIGKNLYINTYGEKDMKIFEAGVEYWD